MEKTISVADAKYANQMGWSDVNPYEIVAVKTDKKILVRPMKCTPKEWKKNVFVGGFAGHVANQHEQKWNIESDAAAPISTIRLTKKGWRSPSAGRFVLATEPKKFYDYNF